MQNLFYDYHFIYPQHDTKHTIRVDIDSKTLTRITDPSVNHQPEWTRLDYHQCGNCPLNNVDHTYCPVATNIVELIELCNTSMSYEEVTVEVHTPERSIVKETTMQRGVSSLLGVLIATSSCPRTDFLKPMARYHLPLSSEEETIYRATSMYLLAQYFRQQKGFDFDLELKGLVALYHDLAIINQAMALRLRDTGNKDSTVNALVLLDLFVKALPNTIEDSLDEIKYLFISYMH